MTPMVNARRLVKLIYVDVIWQRAISPPLVRTEPANERYFSLLLATSRYFSLS